MSAFFVTTDTYKVGQSVSIFSVYRNTALGTKPALCSIVNGLSAPHVMPGTSVLSAKVKLPFTIVEF